MTPVNTFLKHSSEGRLSFQDIGVPISLGGEGVIGEFSFQKWDNPENICIFDILREKKSSSYPLFASEKSGKHSCAPENVGHIKNLP